MTTREGLMAAILAAPDDDLPRLVFADWLEENGEADRAEFIRVQVSIAKQPLAARCPECGEVEDFMMGAPDFPLEYGCPNDHFWGADRVEKLKERERELWQTACGPVICPTGIDGWRVEAAFDERGNVCPQLIRPGNHVTEEVIVTRGFVSEILCTSDEWFGGRVPLSDGNGTWVRPGIGPVVVRSHPVSRVTFRDKVPRQTASVGVVWEPGFDYSRPHQVSFDVAEAGKWKASMINGLMVYKFPTTESATDAMSNAAIEWAKSVTPCESGVQQRTE